MSKRSRLSGFPVRVEMLPVTRRLLLGAAALVGSAGAVLGILAATGVWPPRTPALRSSASGTTVLVRTAAVSTAYLEVGRTRAYGAFTEPSGPGRAHTFELDWLEPNRRYHVRAVTSSDGVTRRGPDLVVATPPFRGTHRLQIADDHFELDGRPWIPRFTWGSCASDYAEEAALGVNAFMSSNCGDSPQRQARAAAKADAVLIPALDQTDRALGTTVATYLPDEPDAHGVSPRRLQEILSSHPNAHGIPVFETFSRLAGTLESQSGIPYADYADLADAVGIDVYPIFNTGDPSRVGDVAVAQRALERVAGEKPTYQWIEATAPRSHPSRTPTRREIEAEAWMAIANGARGLGWWTVGASSFSVEPGARQALRAVDVALDTFAPAIVAPRADLTVAVPGVDAFATRRSGALTVFVVNSSPTDVVPEVFSLHGLAGRPVRVWGSGRTIPTSGDSFADTLPPLAWRIYVVAPYQ